MSTETDDSGRVDGAGDKPGLTILSTETVIEDRWLSFKRRAFLDREGKSGEWSFVERRGKQRAVVVIARTRESGSLVVIRQFRVPMAAWIWEFPAGLVDGDESLGDAALRELKEETGFSGRVLKTGPAVSSSAGLCTEEVHLVWIEVGEESGTHAREAGELIEVRMVKPEEIPTFLAQAEAEKEGMDAKLCLYLNTLGS